VSNTTRKPADVSRKSAGVYMPSAGVSRKSAGGSRTSAGVSTKEKDPSARTETVGPTGIRRFRVEEGFNGVGRCRANSAHASQSRPESSSGFQEKVDPLPSENGTTQNDLRTFSD